MSWAAVAHEPDPTDIAAQHAARAELHERSARVAATEAAQHREATGQAIDAHRAEVMGTHDMMQQHAASMEALVAQAVQAAEQAAQAAHAAASMAMEMRGFLAHQERLAEAMATLSATLMLPKKTVVTRRGPDGAIQEVMSEPTAGREVA